MVVADNLEGPFKTYTVLAKEVFILLIKGISSPFLHNVACKTSPLTKTAPATYTFVIIGAGSGVEA
ncbi:hypothetical protein MWU65_16275 [Cellulophaga sp. F20128]|uniref:hypothetical protein n=1 Tax=Cellulophaga sp. F20128 TaxID=2926413 RepID=UPI001FF6B83F|nr:hypothetical protein [Cellulophaga sp. F20128]MCK0158750.1 hypothetical protein [Cellulophaga sp. F20128]